MSQLGQLEQLEFARRAMREAFAGGFEASGEGFNGEYVGRRYQEPGVLEAELDELFSKWMDKWAFPR